MNIESQVVNLELARKLKELGFNQESYFYYHWYKKNRDYEYIDCKISTEKTEEFDDGKWKLKVYSAFTASELSQMLPSIIHSDTASGSDYSLNIYKPNEYWHINYSSGNKTKLVYYSESLADCMAGILICLITMGIIKNDYV